MNPAHDLAVLKKMAEELPDYLLSDVLFWQLQAPSSFPKLSLGMLLLTRRRLDAADALLDQSQRTERNQASRQVETTLNQWRVAAERKAEHDLRSRVNLWQRYWDDCREEPRTCVDNYRHGVTNRVMAELLMRHFPGLADLPEAQTLHALDTVTRARLEGGQFVWPAELQPGFPEAEFWYLYGRPRYHGQ